MLPSVAKMAESLGRVRRNTATVSVAHKCCQGVRGRITEVKMVKLRKKRVNPVGQKFGDARIVDELSSVGGQRRFLVVCEKCYATKVIWHSQLCTGKWHTPCEHKDY